MSSKLHKQQNLAFLIDAENASCHLTRQLIERAACYGNLAVKRAYADWSRPHLKQYQALLRRHGVEAMHLFRHVAGKNAADIAMVIDVMDLIASGLYHGFCLVTSDSDFTPLAMRIRRAGLKVYGFGAQQTPEVFVQACSRFVYVEGLVRE